MHGVGKFRWADGRIYEGGRLAAKGIRGPSGCVGRQCAEGLCSKATSTIRRRAEVNFLGLTDALTRDSGRKANNASAASTREVCSRMGERPKVRGAQGRFTSPEEAEARQRCLHKSER